MEMRRSVMQSYDQRSISVRNIVRAAIAVVITPLVSLKTNEAELYTLVPSMQGNLVLDNCPNRIWAPSLHLDR